jgi:hypothetical protein
MASFSGPNLVTSGLVFDVDPARTPNTTGGSSYVWYNESVPNINNMGGVASSAAFDTAIATYGVTADTGYHDGVINWGNSATATKWGGTTSATLPSYMPYLSDYHYFCWTAYGQIYCPVTGTYTFNVDGDDACDLWVNNTNVSSFYTPHGFYPATSLSSQALWTSTTISISAIGWYPFRVRMADGNGGNGVSIGWQKPGDGSVANIPAPNMRPHHTYSRVNTGFHTVQGTQAKTDNTVMEFNGSDTAIIYPDNTALNSNTITIEAWVKRSLTSQNGFIFEKGNVNTQYSLFLSGNTCYFRTVLSTGSNDLTFDTNVYLSTVNWNHIVATYTSGTKILYVNGVQVASGVPTGTITTNANGMSIGVYGGYNGARDYWFNGSIGAVRVYNTALSATQVAQNYYATKIRYGL